MSLLAAQALITNSQLRSRVESAIRTTAAERVGWEGAAGVLARAGYTAPDTVAHPFMLRLATNGDVIDAACDACGHAGPVDDDTILWIIGDAWNAIATEIYGPPEPPPTT